MNLSVAVNAPSRWRASLDLELAVSGPRTIVSRRRHHGPLLIQRAFYPETDGTCHLVVLHPPGGVAGTDDLALRTRLTQGARALVTTPSATKFYRSLGDAAQQTQDLYVESGAMLEWFPQETIVFGGAQVRTTTRVHVEERGHFACWDIVCLGRPHSGDGFATGRFRQMLEISDEAGPVFVERATYEALAASRRAPWGLGEKSVVGSFVWLLEDERQARECCDWIANSVPADEPALFSVTAKRRVIVCRYLGDSAQHARRCFIAAWMLLRPTLKREAVCPRIWAT